MIGIANPLRPLEDLLHAVLEAIHGAGLSWAWSVVVLTLIVRVLLVPLTVRQIHSMQRMQRHLPEMKAIQERHKTDKRRRNEELMKFYSENKINPASSCLPILAPLPVFFALFFVLRDFAEDPPEGDLGWLGFLPDISQAANEHWSGFLLLAIYVVSQTVSTLLMPATLDKTQRYLLLALPIAAVFFVVNFPAGLVIYWVTTNLWTVGQGLVTRRLAPKPPPPAKRTSRTPPKGERGAGDGARPAPKPEEPAGPPRPARKVKRKKKRARR